MKKKTLYSASDWKRVQQILPKSTLTPKEKYRAAWRRDYARILHSPCFRRLQGKTQLFPLNESDFFRNRLTHSLEVAQIAKSIAIKLNHTSKFLLKNNFEIKYDICELAGLAHDLGHPPFGHEGEKALDIKMLKTGGFEGNAQTLRILSKIEKRDKHYDSDIYGIGSEGNDLRFGLNLTYRSLASLIKKDIAIPYAEEIERTKPVKGYYSCESEIVRQIKIHVLGTDEVSNFKTLECYIMDVADDIAYSTYDIEDAFKAGFINPLDILSLSDDILQQIKRELRPELNVEDIKEIFYYIFAGSIIDDHSRISLIERVTSSNISSKSLAEDGYIRANFTSFLISYFITHTILIPNNDFPQLSKVSFGKDREGMDVGLIVEVLKTLGYVVLINSPRLRVADFRGGEIVTNIFDSICSSMSKRGGLLPDDYRAIFHKIEDSQKDRIICDFISGMTDRYALEFYGRLHSENPQTIFKDL